ncbi:MAG: hypothetical protein ACRD1T_23685 [Acidimicrobiia bacterium]
MSLSPAEQAAADCLEAYGIYMYRTAEANLRLGGDVNRLEEATLRGPCGRPLITQEMEDEYSETFHELDRMVVKCLQDRGYDASYDRGIAVEGKVPAAIVDDCLAVAYDSVRDAGR